MMSELSYFPDNYQGDDVSGQVVIGNNIVQIGRVEGAVVYVARPGETAASRARPTPVFQRPRRFRGFLDRRQEANTAVTALQSNLPIEFYGQSGIGKTALLRHLAYHLPVDRFPDGVIYLRAQEKTLDDILQTLFDTFYESDIPLKSTMTQLRDALGDKEALILLDDVAVTRGDLEALFDVAPNCAFLMTTEDRRLYGEGRAVALKGLPPEEALALLERELGYPLAKRERTAAQEICVSLQGHPFRLRQLASLARDRNISLVALAKQISSRKPLQQVVNELDNWTISTEEIRVLQILTSVGNAPFNRRHLAALADVRNVPAVLTSLEEHGLVQVQEEQVNLSGGLHALPQQVTETAYVKEKVLVYYINLAEQYLPTPEKLAAELKVIRRLLLWATENELWQETLRMVRAAESAVAFSKDWSAWADMLQLGLRAAHALNDKSAEAWAWHQIGVRALVLGERETARSALTTALHMRNELGETVGAALTRHNLELVLKELLTTVNELPQTRPNTTTAPIELKVVEPESEGLPGVKGMNLTKIREGLRRYFNESELLDLCQDLGIDYEGLSGTSKADKARELVLYCERRGMLDDLINACSRLRPGVDW